jgi:hypothetical protein
VNIKRVMSMRFCLSIGAALAVASVLAAHRTEPSLDLVGGGVVYVYFPSLCAKPGDASDCHEIRQPARPSFESMAACSAHADVELRAANNPRLLASCMKQREI